MYKVSQRVQGIVMEVQPLDSAQAMVQVLVTTKTTSTTIMSTQSMISVTRRMVGAGRNAGCTCLTLKNLCINLHQRYL